jgi:hypothetical protein
MNAFERFRKDVRMMLAMVRNGWNTRMQAQQKTGREGLAMVTLQMFHVASRAIPVIRHTRGSLPDAPDHARFRELLDYLEKAEEGRDLVALGDLERMGYDPARCRETMPLPTTYNLTASTWAAVDEFGPYVFLGAAYASELILDDLRLRFHELYAEDPDLCNCIAFYRIFGASALDRADRTEACFLHYIEDQGLYESMMMGYLSAAKNLLLLGTEIQSAKAYPKSYELPSARALDLQRTSGALFDGPGRAGALPRIVPALEGTAAQEAAAPVSQA